MVTVTGYLSQADKDVLSKYAARSAGPIADVGCHQGLSTAVLAHATTETIYSVDPHMAFRGIGGGEFGPRDRKIFYRNMVEMDIAERVAHVGLPSAKAVHCFDDASLGAVFIDGDHSRATQDVIDWLPKLSLDGYMMLHDIDMAPVQDAILWATTGWDLALVELVGLVAVMRKHGQRLTHAMVDSELRELIFVQIPKAAGISVRYHVAMPNGVPANVTHWPSTTWRTALGHRRYEQALSFAIVRHPATRMRSAWTYLKTQTSEHRWWTSDAAERDTILPMGKTFEEFVRNAPDNIVHCGDHFFPQSRFLTWNGVCDVTRVLRFEHLDHDWGCLMELCAGGGDHLELPRSNATGDRAPISEESRERIAKLYAEDFELLGDIYKP